MTLQEKMKTLGYRSERSLCLESSHRERFAKRSKDLYMSSTIIFFKAPGAYTVLEDYFLLASAIKKDQDIKRIQIEWNNLKRDVEEIKKFLEEQHQ